MTSFQETLKHWIKRDWSILIFFGLMALAAMYPVALHLRSQVIGWKGDNVAYVYMTGWVGESLLIKQSPFFDPRLNYPAGLPLPSNDAPFLSMLAVAPATVAGGAAFGYNLVMLFSSLFSGYFVYLWVVQLTHSRIGGIVGGSAFLLMPYRITHGYGHLNLISTQALPLFFLCLDTLLQQPTPSLRKLTLLAAATAFVGLSSQYYLIICLITGGLYMVVTLVLKSPLRAAARSSWNYFVAMVVGAAVGSLPYLTLLSSGIFKPYNIADTRIWSAALLDFVVPSRLHPLWGAFSEQHYVRPTWIENTLYLGVVSSILAILGLKGMYRTDKQRFWTWLIVMFVAFVFALGTDLHITNNPLQATKPIWLPAYYLGQLPIVNLMRSWARFSIIVMLLVSGLTGVGTSLLIQHWPHRRWQIGTACLALLILDLAPGRLQSSTLLPSSMDHWLAEQPGDFSVAFLPAGSENFEHMFGSLFHAKHLPAYLHGEHQPRAFTAFAQRAANFPAAQSIQQLREMHLRYLIIDRTFYDGRTHPSWQSVEQAMTTSPYLRSITDIDRYRVVALK